MPDMPEDILGMTNLADARLGARAVAASDDFFADKARLIDPAEPVFIPGKYDENGKWMDGWESRRRRGPGYDHCIVRLARPGIVRGFEIDTRHFTGNYPPSASIDACAVPDENPAPSAQWTELIPAQALNGNDQKWLTIENTETWTHVRLNIYPDGGVARLRVYGRVNAPLTLAENGKTADLAAALNGARAVAANDEHFGRLSNILMPGRGINMGDGWETRRRREPGYDWGIIELGAKGTIEEILIDTAHFKGNYPDRIFLQAADNAPGDTHAVIAQSQFWPVLLGEQKLEMDREHRFEKEIETHTGIRFVRINLIPDGGISRIRLFGHPEENTPPKAAKSPRTKV